MWSTEFRSFVEDKSSHVRTWKWHWIYSIVIIGDIEKRSFDGFGEIKADQKDGFKKTMAKETGVNGRKIFKKCH